MKLNKTSYPTVKANGLLAFCTLLASASFLNAVTYEWDVAGPATYNDANNWTPNGVASATDVVIIDNGGTVQIAGSDPDWSFKRMELGNAASTSGFVQMTGGVLDLAEDLRVGMEGAGTFTFVDGTITSDRFLYLGLSAGGAGGVFNQNGGDAEFTLGAVIGHRATSVMTMTAGSLDTLDNHFILGNRTTGALGAHGTLNQSGGVIDTNRMVVGDGAVGSDRSESGVYNISGGAELNATEILIGRSGGNGRVEMTGGEMNVDSFFAVAHGPEGTGIFNQSGGTVNKTSGIAYVSRVAPGSTNAGTWTLSGTAEANLDDFIIAEDETTGTVNLNGGTLSATQIRTEVTGSGTAELNLNGGTIVARADSATFLEGLTLAQVQAGGVTFDTDGNDITIAQDLVDDGAGDVIKAGMGTMTLSGNNTYLGDTVVQAGTLVLADGGSMTFEIGEDGSSNMITGTGVLDLSGILNFDFENIDSTLANSWTIIASTLTASYGENFSIQDFSETESGIWTLVADNLTYEFSESTGVLSAVPEPAQIALLMGLLVVGATVLRRRPRATL